MRTMIVILILSLFLCSCEPLYYGCLPGTSYEISQPQRPIDLQGKTFDLEFHDNRETVTKINCSKYTLNRNTELEGELGMRYFRTYMVTMILNSNGKIDDASPNKVIIEIEGLSFKLIGAIYVVAHGFVQFKVSSTFFNKTYCSDMTDYDKDSPLKWYSLVTRKTGTRTIMSASIRKAVEEFVTDLAATQKGLPYSLSTINKSSYGNVK